MKTKVGLSHEPERKRPWLVYWWMPPDPETSRQRKRHKAFKYKRDAMAFQYQRQLETEGDGHSKPVGNAVLGRLLSEFRKIRLAGLSHKSKECYGNTMEQLRDVFGDACQLAAIDTRRAEQFMASRKRKDGRSGTLSSWSMAQHLKHCRAIFGAAVDWGYLARNPFVPPDRRGKSALRVKGKSRPWQHITPEPFRLILDAAPNVRWRAVYWLMYGCGLRAGEVYNLTIDCMDLDRRRVYVKNRPPTEERPPFCVKADERSEESKERSVPIPEPAVPDLTEAYRLAFKSGGFVALSPERYQRVRANWRRCRAGLPWAGMSKHRPWENRDMLNNVLRDVKRHVQAAGIKLTAPLTLHTFRKSFGQNHADNGTPPRTLAQLLGHSNSRMTMEFYNQVTDANEQAAANTISRLLAAEFHWSSTGAVSEGVA